MKEAGIVLADEFNVTLKAGRMRAERLWDSGKVKGKKIGCAVFFYSESFEKYLEGQKNFLEK